MAFGQCSCAPKPPPFQGSTRYELVDLDGRRVLRASADASASGLFREQRIDLHATPWLHWSWRVERLPPAADETRREGDDYAARLYVVDDGGMLFGRTRALNYFWAGGRAVGSQWPNPFAGENVTMLAVRSGAADTGRWIEERRNVREDLRRVFGEDIRYIDALALMTDTDNGGGQAQAYYGDIWFAAD